MRAVYAEFKSGQTMVMDAPDMQAKFVMSVAEEFDEFGLSNTLLATMMFTAGQEWDAMRRAAENG